MAANKRSAMGNKLVHKKKMKKKKRKKKNLLHINCMNTLRVYVCTQFKLKENWQRTPTKKKKMMTKKKCDSMNEIVRLNFIWRNVQVP